MAFIRIDHKLIGHVYNKHALEFCDFGCDHGTHKCNGEGSLFSGHAMKKCSCGQTHKMIYDGFKGVRKNDGGSK